VLLIILMMQPLIPYKSSSLTRYPDLVRDIKGFNFMLITYFSLRLLIDFQQKVWADHLEMLRTKRIQKLMQKAKLTEIERLYILNFRSKVLDELAINFSKSPRIWKVTLFVFSIILGATLSYYAKNFVDFLGNYIDFKNLIPPF
ncbi:MAG TPA: hypothetical protein VK141_10545, partial [Nitrosomonas sp.]|nr:hypothetical protein [Nitrosomonas sp.]